MPAMKSKLAVIGLFATLCTPVPVQATEFLPGPALRQQINFNRDWKFRLGDFPGAESPRFDDTAWDAIDLPHSFSIPYFRFNEFFVGFGWYRKTFVVPPDWQGKQFFIQFEGAFQDAQIFLNGQPVGEHKGGYTGFSFDITNQIKIGPNILAVRLNNNWNPQIPPRAGEYVFSGGIYRDVYLIVTNPLHVTWYGTFVTTPKVSTDSGIVNVKTEIKNDSTLEKKCTLKTSIVDPHGQLVAQMQSTMKIPADAIYDFDQTSEEIPKPQLWSPDHPTMYRVYTRVYDADSPVDDFQSPFGFRWFQWTPEQGFFLNGQHFYFHGINAHQDHAGWGDAVTDAGYWRDVKLIKDAGFDFLRGSHYPHHPAVADACDSLGVLFWSENCFWGMGGWGTDGFWRASAYPIDPADRQPFQVNCEQSLREMIRVNRNHPSIIAWSMCNEVFFTADLPRTRQLVKDLVHLSHELDPTRPAAVGGVQRGDLDKLGDIAGFNGDGATLFLDPGIPNAVTEYGTIPAIRPGDYDPGWGASLQSQPFPWRSGQAKWCAFDHGSINPSGSIKGIIDYFRIPKQAWFWYRNEYKKIPPPIWPKPGIPARLKLSADKITIHGTDGTDDCQLLVTILDQSNQPISNSPPVTLDIESGPGEFPTGPSITFAPDSDISIADGQAAIEFRSYFAGTTLIRATSPGLEDSTITITTTGSPQFIPNQTPPAQPRPYTRFHWPTNQFAASVAGVNISKDRPVRASSESPGHPARFANDQNDSTSWIAGTNSPNQWWQVDLEFSHNLTSLKILFPTAGNFRYTIEVSEDGAQWQPAIDQSQTTNTEKTRTDLFPPNTHGRYVKITYTTLPQSTPASLSELQLFGTVRSISP
jgi:beta-galactosidase